MKKTILFCLLLISFSLYSRENDKSDQMLCYKEQITFFNKRTFNVDSMFLTFYLIKREDSLFVIDSSRNINEVNPAFIGIYTSKVENCWFSPVADIENKIYDLKDTLNIYFSRDKYIFKGGQTYNANRDTVINGVVCSRFIKYEAGGPGHDVPTYKSVEYVNKSTWMPELIEIEQKFPWARIRIFHSAAR